MNKKEYPLNLLEKIFDGEIDFELATDFDGTLEYVLHTLTDREYQIIKMRFVEGLTYEKCGRSYGVTRERIRQLEVRALRKLKHPSRSAMIKYGIQRYIDNKLARITENYEARLSENYEARLSENKPSDLEIIPIESMDLSVRSYNCLKRACIRTIGDLIKIEPKELASVRNLGKKSYDEIIDKLEKYGLNPQKFIDYKNEVE